MTHAKTPISQQATIPTPKERVAEILQRCKPQIIEARLRRVKEDKQLQTHRPGAHEISPQADRRPDQTSMTG